MSDKTRGLSYDAAKIIGKQRAAEDLCAMYGERARQESMRLDACCIPELNRLRIFTVSKVTLRGCARYGITHLHGLLLVDKES